MCSVGCLSLTVGEGYWHSNLALCASQQVRFLVRGTDSRVFAESGVTRDCFREGKRTVREAVDSCEAERSSPSLSRELAMIIAVLQVTVISE